MHNTASLQQFLESPSISDKLKEQAREKLSKNGATPDVVLEEF